MVRISYQFIVTVDSDEELSDAAKDAIAAALAKAIPDARRITCARAVLAFTADKPPAAIRRGGADLN